MFYTHFSQQMDFKINNTIQFQIIPTTNGRGSVNSVYLQRYDHCVLNVLINNYHCIYKKLDIPFRSNNIQQILQQLQFQLIHLHRNEVILTITNENATRIQSESHNAITCPTAPEKRDCVPSPQQSYFNSAQHKLQRLITIRSRYTTGQRWY